MHDHHVDLIASESAKSFTGARLGRVIAISVAILLASCATVKRDLALEQLSSQWQQEAAPEDRALAASAANEIDQAFGRWRASERKEERAQYAYLVEKKIAAFRAQVELARDQAQLKQLQDDYQDLELQRSKLATERANLEAERARIQALADAEAAERARADAAAANAARLDQERLTELAQAEAEAARRLSEAEAEKAELARREAELRAQQLASLQSRVVGIDLQKTARGTVYVLKDGFFASGQASLSQQSKNKLTVVVEAIQSAAEAKIAIEGHTDSKGAEASNLALSSKRAQSVKQALLELGVAEQRLSAQGFGETMPIASNQTEAGRAKNRRVEIIIEAQ